MLLRMYTRRFSLILLILSVFFLNGCDALQQYFPTVSTPGVSTPGVSTHSVSTHSVSTPGTQTTPYQESTATVNAPESPQTDPTQMAYLNRLILWVPAEFAPATGPAGELLQSQVDRFEQDHPDLQIEIRVKALQGPAGLLTSLENTLTVAPMAAPSLVLFPQSDYQIAASLQLISPQENLNSLLADEDWYDYARELASFQNQVYGLPFAADAQILLYRPAALTMPPSNWDDILAYESPLLFPAGDDKSLFALNLYLSAGGTVYDEQQQIAFDVNALERVLLFFDEGVDAGTFPPSEADYETDQQVWTALSERKGNLSISWTSNYLRELPADIAATTIPPLVNEPVTLVSGWVWAYSDPYPERQEISLQLLAYLTDPAFLADWSFQAGYMPVRPSGMSGWENQVISALLRQATVSARSLPPNDALNLIGPALNEAVTNVLINDYLPAEAARIAVDQINNR